MPTKNLIIFRIDGRGAIGRRSMERCLYLATAHEQRGGRAHFALNERDDEIESILGQRGIGVSSIDSTIGSMADCEELLEVATSIGASAIVIDGAVFESKYLETSAQSLFTAVIDDGGERTLPVQLVINSGFAADERFYTCRADSSLLLGPKFQVLDPEITRWAKPTMTEVGRIPRYYISSIDEHNTARILNSMPSPTQTSILCVSGPIDCPILNAATRDACAQGYTIEHVGPSAVADTLFYCDAAVVCPDSPIGLLAYLGVPSLVIANDSDRTREVRRLAEEEATRSIMPMDELSDNELSSSLSEFFEDSKQRQMQGERLSALVDGNGTTRILDCIRESLRPNLRLLDAA
ncbi:MAG: hypothetical protein JKY56_06825 [Kofleriaceae bacterium]|nr:hypothetical protein [Kofleriaceae bacterium]